MSIVYKYVFTLGLDFELNSVVEDDCVELATFVSLEKNVDECDDGVNDDGGDKDEHPANIHHNFDYPINILCLNIISRKCILNKSVRMELIVLVY